MITYRDPSGTMIEKEIKMGLGGLDKDEFQKELKSVFKEITLAAGTDTSDADNDPLNPFDLTTQGATKSNEEAKDAKISTSNASKLKGVPEGGF